MAFPFDHLDSEEHIMLDTNPSFSRFLWPLLELLAITGLSWLTIGFMDNAVNAASDFGVARQLVFLAWVVLVVWRVGVPVCEWLGDRFVLTNRRILVRRGLFRQRVTSIDLYSVVGVDRKGSTLIVRTTPYGQRVLISDIPSSRKVAKMVNRLA